jgi:molecular chaperone DnaK (HSP70)
MALSTQEKVLLRIPLQQPPLEALLTRQQLDSLAVPLFKRALVPLEDACQQVC